jgi:signal transduction histidine kinase
MTHEGTVLVVDDNADNLGLISAMLTRAGYLVRPALSGELALRAVESGLPDLILLDVRMPGIDGYAVCRRLMASERTRDIPIIFVSANQDVEDKLHAFQAGGVDYVTKPFFEEEVLARVRTHILLYRSKCHLEDLVARRTHELVERESDLRQLSVFLQHVREEDRAHFSRELHDELGQNLTAMRIDFNALIHALKTSDPVLVGKLDAIDLMINSTVDATRRICEDLRPGMLDDLGLEAALSSFTKRFTLQYGVQCDLLLEREDYGLDDDLSTAIFRIVQESLTNIARHADARHAMVSLEERGEDLLLTVADDGCGLKPGVASESKRFGILGMRERVKMLGGRIGIDSAPGRGTHVEVVIPRNGERRS